MGQQQQVTRTYLAYGSNMDIAGMTSRCPSARPVGTGLLTDYRLVFRGGGGWGVLTVEPCDGKSVPVVAWEVTEDDERALDRYEGYPDLYEKEEATVPIVELNDGTEDGTGSGTGNKMRDMTAVIAESMTEGFLYVMRDGWPLGIPSDGYATIVRRGYESFGIDPRPLDEAIAEATGNG